MTFKIFHDYLVYSGGRIYSNKTDKFLKCDCCSSYAQVTLRINGEPKRFKVHRLVAYLFCNPPANYSELEVDHLDGKHFNNHAENLEWVTFHDINGREYMMSELTMLTGKSLSWVYNHIVKFLNGTKVPEFESCGITSIVDLKK